MSVVNRLEIIRKAEELNKTQFEKKISKSTGYLNMLVKRNSNPGVDVLTKIAEVFPHYSLNWILTGQGEMLAKLTEDLEKIDLAELGEDIKEDISELRKELKDGIDTLSDALFHLLKEQQNLIKFIGKLDPDEINEATKNLNKWLEDHKE